MLRFAFNVARQELAAFLWTVWRWKWTIALLLATSICLVWVRSAVIAMLPWAARHYRTVLVATNGIITTFDALQISVDAIVDAISLTMLVLTNGKNPKHIATNFKMIPYVNAREVHDDLTNLAVTCTAHTSGADIATFVARETLNPYVCPLVRALQPTVLADASRVPTAWLTYNVDPNAGTRGCVAALADSTAEWICAGLGTGYVMRDILLVCIVGGLAAYHLVRFFVLVAMAEGLNTRKGRSTARQSQPLH
jgi:hypothetical protein